ncbi:hypothetical protein CYMTET_9635 [Cymbomonas tetramitiformis]|uniref:Uncharacterized protein n=1 Tax=Cymbomonas tetramitiformis TaxID=36881 RepID=A0AAE0GRD7_9CHLO|nr:hypothetical protein CYMTET_9635 [Cymbomonas tetramitiformis]
MQLYTGQRVWLGQLKAKWEWFSIDASTGIFFSYAQRDIRLSPNCIASEDDVYSDLLSRCQVAEFKRRFKEDRQISVWIEDEQLDKIETLTAVLEAERYAHTTQSS